MDVKVSKRLSDLTGYPFAEIDKKVTDLRGAGTHVIDFGVGDPSEPAPEIVRSAIKEYVDVRAASGYPSYVGSREYRDAIAAWTRRRFGVALDPEKEICASIGAKEAVFNFPEAIIDPGDAVIVPNPGYPPYARGTRFAEGEVHYVNLREDRGFLPDLDSIPSDILRRSCG
jgi:LL-diaminopimelate aminotransferase